MEARLEPWVHAINWDGDLVFLDLRADRYVCLARDLSPGSTRPALGKDGRLSGLSEDQFSQLIELGLSSNTAGPIRDHALPDLPTHSLRGIGVQGRHSRQRKAPRGAFRKALAAMAAANLTTIFWRFARLERLTGDLSLGEVRRPRAHQQLNQPSLPLAEAIAVYERFSPWLRPDGACLFRSLHLRAFLRCLGHRPSLVVAVRTWPFMAHCWLQLEGAALDEDLEALLAYRPIWAA